MPALAARRPGHAALRRGRRSLSGQAYLITFTTHERQPLFADADFATVVARATEDLRLWTLSQLVAWVLMPDHWHGIVVVGPGDELSLVLQRLKTNTARQLRAAYPRIGQVWTIGFHDHALRADAALADAARYIVCNPVAAGLVRRIEDYPFWNTAWAEEWGGREPRRARRA